MLGAATCAWGRAEGAGVGAAVGAGVGVATTGVGVAGAGVTADTLATGAGVAAGLWAEMGPATCAMTHIASMPAMRMLPRDARARRPRERIRVFITGPGRIRRGSMARIGRSASSPSSSP